MNINEVLPPVIAFSPISQQRLTFSKGTYLNSHSTPLRCILSTDEIPRSSQCFKHFSFQMSRILDSIQCCIYQETENDCSSIIWNPFAMVMAAMKIAAQVRTKKRRTRESVAAVGNVAVHESVIDPDVIIMYPTSSSASKSDQGGSSENSNYVAENSLITLQKNVCQFIIAGIGNKIAHVGMWKTQEGRPDTIFILAVIQVRSSLARSSLENSMSYLAQSSRSWWTPSRISCNQP